MIRYPRLPLLSEDDDRQARPASGICSNQAPLNIETLAQTETALWLSQDLGPDKL